MRSVNSKDRCWHPAPPAGRPTPVDYTEGRSQVSPVSGRVGAQAPARAASRYKLRSSCPRRRSRCSPPTRAAEYQPPGLAHRTPGRPTDPRRYTEGRSRVGPDSGMAGAAPRRVMHSNETQTMLTNTHNFVLAFISLLKQRDKHNIKMLVFCFVFIFSVKITCCFILLVFIPK